MTLRTAHGKGVNALVRVETAPADELPAGVQGPVQAEAREERTADGRWRAGTRTAQSLGGKSRKDQALLAARVGFSAIVSSPAWRPYQRLAAAFRLQHCRQLAASVGGGVCGSGPSSIVASAALALAASRFLYDTAAGDPDMLVKAARLADSSRQSLLTAHELAAREARSRLASSDAPPSWLLSDDEGDKP